MSDFLQHYGVVILLCSWDSPGKNTGVGCQALLQGIFPTQGSNPRILHRQVDLLALCYQYTTVINLPVHQTHILPRSCTICWESTVNKMEIFLPHCNKFSVWWSQKNEETYNAFWQKSHLNEKLVKLWTEVSKSCISVTRINKFGLRTF